MQTTSKPCESNSTKSALTIRRSTMCVAKAARSSTSGAETCPYCSRTSCYYYFNYYYYTYNYYHYDHAFVYRLRLSRHVRAFTYGTSVCTDLDHFPNFANRGQQSRGCPAAYTFVALQAKVSGLISILLDPPAAYTAVVIFRNRHNLFCCHFPRMVQTEDTSSSVTIANII